MHPPIRCSALAGLATLVVLVVLAACADGTAPGRDSRRATGRATLTLYRDGRPVAHRSVAGALPSIVARRPAGSGGGAPTLSITGSQVTTGSGTATAVDELGRRYTIVRAAAANGLPTRITLYRDGVLQQQSDYRWVAVPGGQLLARDSARHYAGGALDFTVTYVDDGATMQWVGGAPARALAAMLAPTAAHAQSPLTGPCATQYWEAIRAAAAATVALFALPPNGGIPLVAFGPAVTAAIRLRDAVEKVVECERQQRDGGGKTGREEVM
jgi:hypothetical protein